VTVHELGYRAWPEMHTRSQRAYLDLSTRWSANVARRVICVSQATADDLQQIYGTNQDKISVVHEGIDLPGFVTHGKIPRDYGPSPTGRPYALYVGTIQPRKNLARLMQAYASLVASHSIGWDLVLAGKPGWYSDSLFQQADDLNLTDRIHMPGYVPDSELPTLLKNARFFCFPSLHEGFGLPVLEAQAMGVPLVTANNSSLPEIAGDAALLVDPTDVDAIAEAMLRLSRDEALRQHLIAAGYENVKRFSWEKAAAETLAVLEKAAADGQADG
jgi:glycosyltransferase involved in cell wall biosynthesis